MQDDRTLGDRMLANMLDCSFPKNSKIAFWIYPRPAWICLQQPTVLDREYCRVAVMNLTVWAKWNVTWPADSATGEVERDVW